MTSATSIGPCPRKLDPVAGGPCAAPDRPTWISFAGGAGDCGDLWEPWRRLSADAPPFLQPEFFELTRPIADPAGEPYLAVAVLAERVAGVLPVTLHGPDLHPLRSEHSPRFDFWGDSSALSAIWEALRANPRWERLVLGHIPAESPLATELPMLARRWGCFIKASPSHGVPYFLLPGFEEQLDSKFRTNIRRCTRKAGDLGFERHTAPSPHSSPTPLPSKPWPGRVEQAPASPATHG